ncbi:hypothetical protein [Variovorax boronicumulans]|uniref:hypothetical protein n=1 Tax=Variovorax boronicumulans TaxID=436515 RepID=UPI001F0A6BA6|nr:hypothetical protein [Variovorax boronicumulans]
MDSKSGVPGWPRSSDALAASSKYAQIAMTSATDVPAFFAINPNFGSVTVP